MGTFLANSSYMALKPSVTLSFLAFCIKIGPMCELLLCPGPRPNFTTAIFDIF